MKNDDDVADIIDSFPDIQFTTTEIEMFRDLCGNNNLMHFDPQDIINFFKTPGDIISGCIPGSDIAAHFYSAKTGNIKKNAGLRIRRCGCTFI